MSLPALPEEAVALLMPHSLGAIAGPSPHAKSSGPPGWTAGRDSDNCRTNSSTIQEWSNYPPARPFPVSYALSRSRNACISSQFQQLIWPYQNSLRPHGSLNDCRGAKKGSKGLAGRHWPIGGPRSEIQYIRPWRDLAVYRCPATGFPVVCLMWST